ncbi:hypothetical protein B0J18DRAFT_51657 [Chaetomium sp. MPI-SDFR-AT-0129]|nr:hypothetical protein B0J18DRAFT_51657 [Chaetomium sp. MPI-SDFR-AT-0129]
MTDKPPPLPTPLVVPSQPTLSLPSAVSRDVTRKQETADEEPYTIKCICGFPDDDGNTIYCETCDTWQHIECYYPNSVEDALRPTFAHSCVECEPRLLNHEQAIARQKAKMAVPVMEATADKKPKRPPSKSHKKKPKPSDLQINGVSHGTPENKHASPSDNPHPTKKAKNSHKPSQSISSQTSKRSPPHGNTKTAQNHPLSPATTPPDLPNDFELHNYSSGFVSLYNDQAFQIVNTNSYAGLQVSNTMLTWLRDPHRMQAETGCSPNDVFQTLPDNMDLRKVAPEVEQDKKVISPGTTVQCRCLKAPSDIKKDVPLMEVNGQIGFQAAYCADPENRYSELTAPLPFVLFHPSLPLYIDTRREGSEARFVRRSCRPNAVLETFISSGSEYHFWLVSDRRIAAREQITIAWDCGFPAAEKARALQVLGLGDDVTASHVEPSVTENDYQKYSGWVHSILSEHGGCACNLGPECSFARFHRNYLAQSQSRPGAPKSKKRKPKSQHAISPTSTGHATNSRAASEGHLEEVPENERRSVSGSSRSKPPSRDMTPTARQGSFDTLGILTEPTDRDKRKVAMVEDSFRRMEQQQHQYHQQQQQQPQRKRKRASDGASTNQTKSSKPGSATQTPNLPTGFPERGYVDAGTGTSRGKSGSPSGSSPTHVGQARKIPPSRNSSAPAPSRPNSAAPRAKYCDAAVQTDFSDVGDTTAPRRRVGSCLRKRMLESWHHVRIEEEERSKRRTLERPSTAVSMESQSDQSTLQTSPASSKGPEKGPGHDDSGGGLRDVTMMDAQPVSPAVTTIPSPVPAGSLVVKTKSPELRVEMPPVPTFPAVHPTASPASTPVSAGPGVAQSPFSVTSLASPFAPPSVNSTAPTPSPVKKKLSFNDYKSRMNKAGAARPSVGTTLLKPVSDADEPKSATSTDGGVATSSPVMEKPGEGPIVDETTPGLAAPGAV